MNRLDIHANSVDVKKFAKAELFKFIHCLVITIKDTDGNRPVFPRSCALNLCARFSASYLQDRFLSMLISFAKKTCAYIAVSPLYVTTQFTYDDACS